MATLTKSELQVLRELDGAPDKELSFSSLARSAPYSLRLTQRGLGLVLSRLENRNLVVRNYEKLCLTFGGMRALAAVDQVHA